MAEPYRATPEQWADAGAFASDTRACILELRARVEQLERRCEVQLMQLSDLQARHHRQSIAVRRLEAEAYTDDQLEADSQPTPNPNQIRSSLDLCASDPFNVCRPNHPAKPDSSLVERVQQAIGHSYPDDARAAILEVAAALREVGSQATDAAVFWLEQEAER